MNKYKTSDLYLSAFLKFKGFKYEVEKLGKKVVFLFDETPELLKLVNDYLTENASCDPLGFTYSIKNLKTFYIIISKKEIILNLKEGL